MTSDLKEYLKMAGYGAVFGISTSVISGLSNELIRQPLGFSPLSIKNLLKVGVLSGGTLGTAFAIDDKWGIFTKIGL